MDISNVGFCVFHIASCNLHSNVVLEAQDLGDKVIFVNKVLLELSQKSRKDMALEKLFFFYK